MSSIIFLPYGTVKVMITNSYTIAYKLISIQGPPQHAFHMGSEITEEDYIDTIAITKAPDEAYVQLLEQQQLAIRNMKEGYEFDTTWDYDDIYMFLRGHFTFLFRYFEEGPNADSYASETPFLIVHKAQRTLSAVPYNPASLNGDVLCRNSAVHKSGLCFWKMLFGGLTTKISLRLTYRYCCSHTSLNPIFNPDFMEQREIRHGCSAAFCPNPVLERRQSCKVRSSKLPQEETCATSSIGCRL